LDGRIIAFASRASNLVGNDTNGKSDVFVHDRSTGITERDSIDSFGAEAVSSAKPWDESRGSYAPSLSANGETVAFMSDALNLVPNDTNVRPDVFAHDRPTGYTERVSVGAADEQGDQDSRYASVSANGQVVAFTSSATLFVPGDANHCFDVFIRYRSVINASWSNYGQGFPGTNGIPSLTSASNPVLGKTLQIDLSNSSGGLTFAMVFIGFQKTQIHAAFGGDLLVVPTIVNIVGLGSGGTSFIADLPLDETLCGLEIDMQAWESDPGASRSVSFTPGLELVIGH